MHTPRTHLSPAVRLLEGAGIQPTRQRRLLAGVVLERPVHMTAEQVLEALRKNHAPVSRATVYNTLDLFVRHGLLKELCVQGLPKVYDSTTKPHHHLYDEESGEISDLPAAMCLSVRGLEALADMDIAGIEVMVRVRKRRAPAEARA